MLVKYIITPLGHLEVYPMFSEILALGRLPFEPVFCSILGMFLCEGGVGLVSGKGKQQGSMR